MAEDSDTLKIRMLRSSGRDKETQWFEYRPAFNADIVRISWELDTMDVELDTGVAEHLLRMGYAAPLPEGSAPEPAPIPTSQAASPAPPVETPAVAPTPWEKPPAEEPPPPAPSWLKPNGGA